LGQAEVVVIAGARAAFFGLPQRAKAAARAHLRRCAGLVSSRPRARAMRPLSLSKGSPRLAFRVRTAAFALRLE